MSDLEFTVPVSVRDLEESTAGWPYRRPLRDIVKRDIDGCEWRYNAALGIYEKTPKDEGCFRSAGL